MINKIVILSVVKRNSCQKCLLRNRRPTAMLPWSHSWSCQECKSHSSFHYGGSGSRNRSEVCVCARARARVSIARSSEQRSRNKCNKERVAVRLGLGLCSGACPLPPPSIVTTSSQFNKWTTGITSRHHRSHIRLPVWPVAEAELHYDASEM